MAGRKNTKQRTSQELDAINAASLDLGRAGGLAETLQFLAEERPEDVGIEGVMRMIRTLVAAAYDKVGGDEPAGREVSAALDVCELVMMDSQEATYKPSSAFMWALDALAPVIQHAKSAVDGIQSLEWSQRLEPRKQDCIGVERNA